MTSTFLLLSLSTLYHDGRHSSLNFWLISQLLVVVYLTLIPNFLNPLRHFFYLNFGINGLFKPSSNNRRPKVVGFTRERTSGHSLIRLRLHILD